MVNRLLAAVVHLPRDAAILLVRGYRLFFRAWVGNVCAYEPSCSAYALQALQRHGAVDGSYLAARRVLRCRPWCEGGHDPVPEAPGLFTRLTAGAFIDPPTPRKRPL